MSDNELRTTRQITVSVEGAIDIHLDTTRDKILLLAGALWQQDRPAPPPSQYYIVDPDGKDVVDGDGKVMIGY